MLRPTSGGDKGCPGSLGEVFFLLQLCPSPRVWEGSQASVRITVLCTVWTDVCWRPLNCFLCHKDKHSHPFTTTVCTALKLDLLYQGHLQSHHWVEQGPGHWLRPTVFSHRERRSRLCSPWTPTCAVPSGGSRGVSPHTCQECCTYQQEDGWPIQELKSLGWTNSAQTTARCFRRWVRFPKSWWSSSSQGSLRRYWSRTVEGRWRSAAQGGQRRCSVGHAQRILRK